MLKKIKHCGTMFAGVQNPDSLAEHIARASQIAFVIASEEKADAYKTAMMIIIHDNAEIRIGDFNNINKKYLKPALAENQAFRDQIKGLPTNTGQTFYKLFHEFEEQKTLESKCARDADHLETCLQAKEYYDLGYKTCMKWLTNTEKYLQTKTGKALFKKLKKTRFDDWFQTIEN